MSLVMSLVLSIGSSCFMAPWGNSSTIVWTELQQHGSNFSCRGVLTGTCMRYRLTPALWSSGHVHTTHISIKPAQSQLGKSVADRVCVVAIWSRDRALLSPLYPPAVDGRVLVALPLGHSPDLLGACMKAETCFLPPNTACIDPALGQRGYFYFPWTFAQALEVS